MTKQRESLNDLKLFITKLMNEEQDLNSKSLELLKGIIGEDLGQDTIKIVNEIFKAKLSVLNKVYTQILALEKGA